MLQRIRKKEFSNCVENGVARFKVFPGGTTERINYYLVPELRENRYKKVVIHCGTNDLYDKSGEEIVRGMEEIYETCMSHGVETIIFSGIVYRRGRQDVEEKRLFVNSILECRCRSEWLHNTKFVVNSNILDTDLYKDGLHLIESGTIKLANNILNCININN